MLELEHEETLTTGADVWNIIDEGVPIGFVVANMSSPNTLRVNYIEARRAMALGVPFGAAKVRQLLRLIKQEYPEATQVEGRRASGVRTFKPEEEQEVTRRI